MFQTLCVSILIFKIMLLLYHVCHAFWIWKYFRVHVIWKKKIPEVSKMNWLILKFNNLYMVINFFQQLLFLSWMVMYDVRNLLQILIIVSNCSEVFAGSNLPLQAINKKLKSRGSLHGVDLSHQCNFVHMDTVHIFNLLISINAGWRVRLKNTASI